MQNEQQLQAETLLREIQSLTPEEEHAFRTCMQKEAVINSALPFALFSGISGYISMSITPAKKYAKHMAIFGGIVGYVVGKTIYGMTCLQKSVPRMRKLLQPNQYLTDSVEQRDGFEPSTDKFVSQYSEQPSVSASDFGDPISSFDSYSSPNDSNDLSTIMETDLTEPLNLQPNVSYDDLRQKNRAENRTKSQSFYRERPVVTREAKEKDSADIGIPPAPKNKYGDVWG